MDSEKKFISGVGTQDISMTRRLDFSHLGARSTMDCVLALHPAAPGWNLGRDIFSLLLCFRPILRSNPSTAKSKWYRKCRAAKAKAMHYKKIWFYYGLATYFLMHQQARLSDAWLGHSSAKFASFGGLHSTEVTYLLPSQQPQVRIPAHPRFFLFTA